MSVNKEQRTLWKIMKTLDPNEDDESIDLADKVDFDDFVNARKKASLPETSEKACEESDRSATEGSSGFEKCELSLETKVDEENPHLDKIENTRIVIGSETNPISEDASRYETNAEEIDRLKEKLARTRAKLYETKDVCAGLRRELRKSEKLLRSETGIEDASTTSLSSGWSGRADQIRQLRLTVSQLRCKLGEYEKSSNARCYPSAGMTREEGSRKNGGAEELARAEMALETCRKKLAAAGARIKVLENDLSVARRNLALLNEKRIHDDQLIEALNAQLRAVEDKYREGLRVARAERKNAEEARDEARNELTTANSRLELFRRKLEEKEAQESLRERESAEGKTAASSEDKDLEAAEYAVAKTERRRLLELVAMLNQRLDKERNESDLLTQSLRRERLKCAKLETKVQRLEMGKKPGIYRSGMRGGVSTVDCSRDADCSDETRFKLELLEEERLALVARLERIEREKLADLAIYEETLEQTRATFRDALRLKSQKQSRASQNTFNEKSVR